MKLEILAWGCENCGFNNELQIDIENGPVGDDICSGCGNAYEIGYLFEKGFMKGLNHAD
jgi:hypothetical protein